MLCRRFSRLLLLMVFLLLFFGPFSVFANPSVPASSPEKALAEAKARLELFDRDLPLADRRILKNTNPRERFDLSPRLRNLYLRRQRLREDLSLWGETVSLQKDLLQLSENPPESDKIRRIFFSESGKIAETAIRSFGELRQKYGMIRPAFFHNILVNAGLKDEGFCWHWTRDLQKRLSGLSLTGYELRWATAREGTPREHNTLVIVPKGKNLEEGLLLDGWRRAGKPFWTRVQGDKYPWRPGEYQEEEER